MCSIYIEPLEYGVFKYASTMFEIAIWKKRRKKTHNPRNPNVDKGNRSFYKPKYKYSLGCITNIFSAIHDKIMNVEMKNSRGIFKWLISNIVLLPQTVSEILLVLIKQKKWNLYLEIYFLLIFLFLYVQICIIYCENKIDLLYHIT